MAKVVKKKVGRERGGATLKCPNCQTPTWVELTYRSPISIPPIASEPVFRDRYCSNCGYRAASVEMWVPQYQKEYVKLAKTAKETRASSSKAA